MNIYVGNLSWNMTSEDLENLFTPFGAVACNSWSGSPILQPVIVVIKPARVGAQAIGPALQVRSGSRGATRTSCRSPLIQARIVTASPERLARTVTSLPIHSAMRDEYQSDVVRVTTAPTWGYPSQNSIPAFTQFSSSALINIPAWSNCYVKSRMNETSIALSLGK